MKTGRFVVQRHKMQRSAQPDQKRAYDQQKNDTKGQEVNEIDTDNTRREDELDADL